VAAALAVLVAGVAVVVGLGWWAGHDVRVVHRDLARTIAGAVRSDSTMNAWAAGARRAAFEPGPDGGGRRLYAAWRTAGRRTVAVELVDPAGSTVCLVTTATVSTAAVTNSDDVRQDWVARPCRSVVAGLR
jgi:hypothetical protein